MKSSILRLMGMSWAVLFVCAVFLARTSEAADRYWVASSSGNWSDTANWSTTSGGAGGATVPGSSDVAIFNVSRVANCLLNVNVNVLGFRMLTGYTGTVTQGAGFSVTVGATGFTQQAGSFVGGANNITIEGSFTLSGGAFASTTALMRVRDDWAFTGGSFTHNGGTVAFRTASGAADYQKQRTLTGSATFHHLEFVAWGGNAAYNMAAGTTFTVVGTFSVGYSDGREGGYSINTGTIIARGDISVSGAGSRVTVGSASLIAAGAGDQTMASAGGGLRLGGGFTVEKSSGVISMTGNWTLGRITLASGVFNATSGTLVMMGDWTNTGGAFSHNGGTVNFGNGVFNTGDYSFNVADGEAETFHNLTVDLDQYYSSGNGIGELLMSAGSRIIVEGTFRQNGGAVNTGVVEARGDITIGGGGAQGGTATMLLSGANDQAINHMSETPIRGHWTIDKPSGAVRLASGLSLNGAGQSLSVLSGVLNLNGYNLTVNNQLVVGSAGTLRLQGGETLNKTPTLQAGSTVAYSGDGVYPIRPWSYHSLSLEGTGSFSLSAPLSLPGDWSKADAATFAHNDHAVTLTGANQTMRGSTAFAALTKIVSSASTLTFEAASLQTVTGALTLKGPGAAEESAKADSSVQGGADADTNFGDEATMMVRNAEVIDDWHEAYLRFDVSGYSSIDSAVLRLYPEAVGSAHTQECRPVTDDWDELDITYNLRPAAGGPIGSWTPQAGVPVEIDITALAQTALSGDGKVSVCIRGVTEGADAWASYSSRESAEAGRRPRLVIAGKGTATTLPLRSTEPGARWEIDPQGARDIEFLDVQDSNNINATRISAIGKFVVNSGRNIGWSFDTSYIEVTQRAGTFVAGTGTVIAIELWDGEGALIGDSATQITFTPVGAAAAEIVDAGGVGQARTVTASAGTASISIIGQLTESFVIQITNNGGYDNPPDEPVTVVASAPHEVRVNVPPEDFPAGGSTTIEVYIYDQYGNHCLADDSTVVTFTPSADLRLDGGEAGEDAILTVVGGAASVAVSGTVAGTHTVTVSSAIEDPAEPLEVEVFHGTGVELVTTAHPAGFFAGGSTTMTVELHDAYGNKVLDEAVELAFSFAATDTAEFAGGSGSGQPFTVVMAAGEATVTVSNTKAETFEIHVANDASLNGPSPNPETVTVTHAASAAVVVTEEPASFPHGTSTTMRLEVRDAYGNHCSGDDTTEITFTPGGGSSAALSALVGAVVSGDGSAGTALTVHAAVGVARITIANSSIEEFTISWTGTVGAPGERTLWSYAGDPVAVVVAAEPADFTAGGSTFMTVRLNNSDGIVCAHDNTTQVTFTPSSAGRVNGGALGQPATVAATAGQITVTISSTLAHPNLTVSVSSGLATNPSARTMAVAHAAPHRVAVTREPSDFAAHGKTSMRVAVRDEYNNHCVSDSSTEIAFEPSAGSDARLSVGIYGTAVSGTGGAGEAMTLRAASGQAEIGITSQIKETFTISIVSALDDPLDRTISVSSFAGLGEGKGCSAGTAGVGGASAAVLAMLAAACAAVRRRRGAAKMIVHAPSRRIRCDCTQSGWRNIATGCCRRAPLDS